MRTSQTYEFRKEQARIMANHEDRGRSWVSASSSRCPLTRAARACGMWGRKVRYCARPHGERGMTLSPGGRDAGLERDSAGRAVWPLRTEDPRLAPAGAGVGRAGVGARARAAHRIRQSRGVSVATEVRSAGSTEDPRLRRELH